jgi:hypothetical protein
VRISRIRFRASRFVQYFLKRTLAFILNYYPICFQFSLSVVVFDMEMYILRCVYFTLHRNKVYIFYFKRFVYLAQSERLFSEHGFRQGKKCIVSFFK